MTVRITESDLARDVRAVLAKVEQGDEVIIEGENHQAVAVMKQARQSGRKITECIALAKAFEASLGYLPVPDEDFARDVQAGIDERREPLRNVWDE